MDSDIMLTITPVQGPKCGIPGIIISHQPIKDRIFTMDGMNDALLFVQTPVSYFDPLYPIKYPVLGQPRYLEMVYAWTSLCDDEQY